MKLKLLLIFFLTTTLAKGQTDPTWVIKTQVNPNQYFGATLANGVTGITSSPNPFEIKETVLNGAYDSYGRGRVSNILKTFNLLKLSIRIDGNSISNFNHVTNMEQTLDMKKACLTTSFDYQNKARITYTIYALRNLPFCTLGDISVKALKKINLSVASIIETPDILRDTKNYFHQIGKPSNKISLLTSSALSPTEKLFLAGSNAFLFNENELPLFYTSNDSNAHRMSFEKQINENEAFDFGIVGTNITSQHHEDPLNEAERLTIFATLQGKSKLIELHQKAWDKLWQSDIIIEGEDKTQQDVRFMLYNLYASVCEGSNMGLSPMGLSGLGYNGHSFWDTELWMFPALLALQPNIAKSLIDYRIDRLKTAQKNAFSHGYKGAMFPWESALSGNEETPVWALTGPFEHHITADVAIAAWNYYLVTQDTKWLETIGYPLLKETADFWVSRVEKDEKDNLFHIRNVVAADEWAENVDDNAFTNAAAKANLAYAIQAAKILKTPHNPEWENVKNNIPILKDKDGVTLEYKGYQGQSIKQADVNLLAFPLKEVTKKEDIKKDLLYYESRVGNGPAMTHAIFSILYSKLEQKEKAFECFQTAYIPNQRPPFGVLAETKTGNNPYFLTGAGGVLQSLLYGFGGLEISDKGIIQNKGLLPKNWKSITLKGIGLQKNNYSVH